MLGSDLNLLTSMLLNICERHPHHRDYTLQDLNDALRELMVDFPVCTEPMSALATAA